ncbi:MAG TPA: outer membrane lipoprotein-sorting protein [Spirochaetota bacterium]|nr:outer membrane lipoprotein-sorting protein [Spirochaetota bacterium]HPJ35682.1 outer membrane lipoprotein-sorting protein [Spirochaetota bacterium]
MKSRFIPVFSSFLFLTAGVLFAQDNMSGEEIARKAHDSNKSSRGILLKGKMTLAGVGGGSSDSRSVVLITYNTNGLSKGLVRFTDSSYRGTTMLTQERKGRDNLQYLYLPSVGSPRQIEGSDREKNFVDTDFSNEDLGGSRIEDYTYKRLPDKKAGGYDCYVIERYPKKSSSRFSRHVVTIDKSSMLPLEVKFYARSGRLVKSMKAAGIKQISGSINVPMHMEVVDIEKRHKTVINVSTAQEKNINRGYFNRNRMSMQWAEQ